MSDAATVETPKQRGRPKGSKNRKPVVPSDIRTPVEQKLDHFSSTKNARELDWWEADPTLSAVHVPQTLKDKYPDRAWKFCSFYKRNKYGKNYHGWEEFTDAAHPDGIKIANDNFLAWMPSERAQRYRDYVGRVSTERVRGKQETQAERTARSGEGIVLDGNGLVIGERGRTEMHTQTGRTIHGGGGRRGYHPEEIKEMVAKEREKRSVNRKYFTS